MPGSGVAMEEDLLGPEWLFSELRSQNGPNKLLILDCRAHSDFSDAHIRGSVPLAIPSIMLRRLAAGKVDLLSTIRCLDLRNRVEVFLCGDESSRGTFVLIGDSTDPAGHQGETIQVLSRRLKSSGGNVAILIGERCIFI
ncbi:dual specificity protein phosphatase mpk3-like protein [Lasius niger]|uniref:Dual specificity protein phosphatase mpk3-like protein n=1 Tax=Lasius niger TaxID=67767 RepID=A0A0J7KJS3_LASNI|nr:dual specificity protein phosphatase mpk3-like protein [Lasius niger]